MSRDFLYLPTNATGSDQKPNTGTDLAGNKRAQDVVVLNPVTQPIPVYNTAGAGSVTPSIFNVPCAIADQEYSQALPANCREFIIRARNNSKIKFAYVTAAANYLTIETGVSFKDSNSYLSQTIYFRCSKADEVIEIVTYA